MPTVTLINDDDPIFDFVHAMTHRQHLAVMSPLTRFTAIPYNLYPEYDTGLPYSAWDQDHQQAHGDFNSTLPGYSSNGFSIVTVTPPTVTGTGTTTAVPPTNPATTISLTGLSGSFLFGSNISGSGIPAGTTIISHVSGAIYALSHAYTMPTPSPVTITHPPYQQATPITGHSFGINQSNILIEGSRGDDREMWLFWNHMEHRTADNAILPLPTQAPTVAGTGPGTVEGVSDPWWWAAIGGEIIYPYW